MNIDDVCALLCLRFVDRMRQSVEQIVISKLRIVKIVSFSYSLQSDLIRLNEFLHKKLFNFCHRRHPIKSAAAS